MPLSKGTMSDRERFDFEAQLARDMQTYLADTREDLEARKNGVPTANGGGGFQFVGYTQLERFYRGDQWFQAEPEGASQRIDNYCAVIVDNISSLVFDDQPEINCPTDDPADDVLEARAEAKERLIQRVYTDNEAATEFDELSKVGSLYGDTYLMGPWMEKVDELGNLIALDDARGKWVIRFAHVENPAAIRPIWEDTSFKRMFGYIHEERILLAKAEALYGAAAKARGIKFDKSIADTTGEIRADRDTHQPMVMIRKLWTKELMAVFIKDKLVDYWFHNWGFVTLEHIKNTYTPNHPGGKSDLEDLIDPQGKHNRIANDLANLLRWVSSINLWGKNVEGMQALVAGLSRIYALPDEGELHAFEKTGDPYVAQTAVGQARSSIIDIAGVGESFLSSSQLSVASGRALALAFQGTLRKLNPRLKRYAVALQKMNSKILRLYELYFPETKAVIRGDYRNEVFLAATVLRNVVDTINKLQSGLISLDTAQKEVGVKQVKTEQRMIKKTLQDPVLGPQIARQPALLPQLQEGANQPGEQPIPGPGQRFASPGGAVAGNNQQASGAAPTPVTE